MVESSVKGISGVSFSEKRSRAGDAFAAAAVGAHRHLSLPSLAGLPGFAKRPERNPEQGQVLDEELPRGPREGGEAAGTRRPDARRGDEEAQGREEHPDRQGAPEGGSPRRERASGDEQRDGDLDDAKHGREAW